MKMKQRDNPQNSYGATGQHLWVVWYMNNGESPEIRIYATPEGVREAGNELIGKYDRVGFKRMNLEKITRDGQFVRVVLDKDLPDVEKVREGVRWCRREPEGGECYTDTDCCPYIECKSGGLGCTESLFNDILSLLDAAYGNVLNAEIGGCTVATSTEVCDGDGS